MRRKTTDRKTAKRQIAESKAKRTAAPRRTPDNQNRILLDRISARFKYVPLPIKEEQLLTIGRALAVLNSYNDPKRFMTETEAVEYFTLEQLQRMLLMKEGKVEIH